MSAVINAFQSVRPRAQATVPGRPSGLISQEVAPRVLAVLHSNPQPLTAREIATLARLKATQVYPVMSTLLQAKQVSVAGEVVARSGNATRTYVIRRGAA